MSLGHFNNRGMWSHRTQSGRPYLARWIERFLNPLDSSCVNLLKEPRGSVWKADAKLEGDWTNLLSITLRQTNRVYVGSRSRLCWCMGRH